MSRIYHYRKVRQYWPANFGYETGSTAFQRLVLVLTRACPQDRTMYMVLRHFDGRLEEAMLLSLGTNSMRVSVPGGSDTLQLTLRDGQWISEDNTAVEIEFISATAEDEWRHFFERRLVQCEIDAWAAKPLPAHCVPAPSSAGRLWN